jgi:hypothetical protein
MTTLMLAMSMQGLIGALLVLVILGVICWLVNAFVPMQGAFKTVFNVICVIILILWLLSLIGYGPVDFNFRS